MISEFENLIEILKRGVWAKFDRCPYYQKLKLVAYDPKIETLMVEVESCISRANQAKVWISPEDFYNTFTLESGVLNG